MASNSILNKIDIKLCDMEDTINTSLSQLDDRYNKLKELLVYSLKEVNNQIISPDLGLISAYKQSEETILAELNNKYLLEKENIKELFDDIDNKVQSISINSDNINIYKSSYATLEHNTSNIQTDINAAYDKYSLSISSLENDTYQTLDYIKEILNKNNYKNSEMKDTYANTLSDIEGRSNLEVNELKRLRAEFEQNVFAIIEDVYNKLTD